MDDYCHDDDDAEHGRYGDAEEREGAEGVCEDGDEDGDGGGRKELHTRHHTPQREGPRHTPVSSKAGRDAGCLVQPLLSSSSSSSSFGREDKLRGFLGHIQCVEEVQEHQGPRNYEADD